MNGTVTLETYTTLIEADTFNDAYEKLKECKYWSMAVGVKECDDCVTYTIPGDYNCYGRLQREPARVL